MIEAYLSCTNIDRLEVSFEERAANKRGHCSAREDILGTLAARE